MCIHMYFQIRRIDMYRFVVMLHIVIMDCCPQTYVVFLCKHEIKNLNLHFCVVSISAGTVT